MPNYDGFSDREKGFVSQAFAQMRLASAKARAALLSGDLKAYRKWFEANGPRFADGGAELQPARTATTIRKRGDKVVVGDGPFIEAKEGIGGFSIVEAKDLTEAIALAKTWPGHGVEVRPLNEEQGA